MEHIPITPSSELMLKIEEIPPLDVFYSPQHKVVVRIIKKKRKLENVLSHDAEQLNILWQDPTTDPTEISPNYLRSQEHMPLQPLIKHLRYENY